MATKIGDILPFVGGAEFAHLLVPLLEILCTVEEVTARTAAAVSAGKIIAQLKPTNSTSVQAFYELFQRLSSDEAGEIFYGRISACQMIPEMYNALPAVDRPALREVYNKLIADELPMVRRSAALSFIKLSSYAEPEALTTEFLQMMKATASDEHATVRVTATLSLNEFASLLKKVPSSSSALTDLLPTIKAAVEDPSWRIRQGISKNYVTFATSYSGQEVKNDLFPGGILLMQDSEPEVRTSALQSMPAFVAPVTPTAFLAQFAPMATQLVEDPNSGVRKVLAEVCIDVAALIGADLTAQSVADILMRLIADEDPLVRLRILNKLSVLAEAAPAMCSRLTEPMKKMFIDSNWRVRKGLAQAMPPILKHMGIDYFMEHFRVEFQRLLKDGVDEVRAGCCWALPHLVKASNPNWFQEKIFPSVREMASNEFLVRLSMLSALEGLVSLDIPEKFQTEILALIIGATNDKVPNIRVRAAQVLGPACKAIGPENSRMAIRPVLAELLNDKDRDVKYFAAQSLESCA